MLKKRKGEREMEKNLIIGIQEKPKSIKQWILLSLQHVFAMFGATVLVPLLTGLDSSVALVASGVGTLIYILCTRAKVPVYLGSSFAYISAIAAAGLENGFSSAYVGLIVVGLIYVIVSFIIRFAGSGWIKKLLPPVVIGPMIIIIGLGLANVAIGQAGLNPNHESLGFLAENPKNALVALVTFIIVVLVALLAKGFAKIVPFLFAIIGGYVFSVMMKLVVLQDVFKDVQFFQIPNFEFIGTYQLDFTFILTFIPIAFVTIAEHIGDHTVLGEVCDEDFITDPGLDKTLLGDGIATAVSAMIGGPANTTYGENTGVVAMTKVGSVYVTGLAAIFAIMLGFFGYVHAFINSIPLPVMGGISILLFGLIAGNGVKVLIKAKVDLSDMRNMVIVASMLVVGIGGALLHVNEYSSLQGMSLAAVVGIVLNLLFVALDPYISKN
jgi:uracil permease